MIGYLVAFAQALCFAATSIMLKQLSQRMNLYLSNGIRAMLAILMLLPIIALTGGWADLSQITWLRYGYLAASVILGGVFGEVMYINSLRRIGVSRTFPITNAVPVFTVIFSVLLLGEDITWLNVLGLVVVMAGVYIIARPGTSLQTVETTSRHDLIVGVLLALGAALVWGLGTVAVAAGAQGINGVLASTVRLPIVVAISLFMAWRQGAMPELKYIDTKLAWLLLFAALLSWVMTRTLYVVAVQMIGPSRTAIISATAPMFAIPMSMIILKERPSSRIWSGALLTIVGIVLVV